jgi:predicted metal-binding membrane protein
MAVLPLGLAMAASEIRFPVLARAVPVTVGIVVLSAGALQFTRWKRYHLACCRQTSTGPALRADVATAFRHGLRLGVHCGKSCLGFVAILLGLGVMNLRVMSVVAIAITAERLAPPGERVARTIGVVMLGAGLVLVARAAGIV